MGSLQGTENNMFTITMPAISCSSPSKVHPDAPHLIEVGNAWLQVWCRRIFAACERFQLPTASQLFSVDHNVNSAYGFLATLCFANAVSTQRVVPVLKFLNWFFLIDTCVDEPSMFGADPAKSTHLIDSVATIFCKPTPRAADHKPASPDLAKPCPSRPSHAAHEELAHILASAAAEWWSDMCVDMPLSQRARFSELFLGYLNSVLKETPFRSAHMLPDVKAYLHIRSQTIGWYPVSVLTEYSLCMEMEQEAITSPLLVALKQCVCESVVLINDVMSFCKEYERGDHFNIIMVLCNQNLQAGCNAMLPGTSSLSTTSWQPLELAATPELLQESMNEACEMIKERNEQCGGMIEKVKKDRRLMEIPGMGAFVEAMGNYVPANLYWHLSSKRYWPHTSSFSIGHSPDLIVKNMASTALVSRPVLLRSSR